MYTNYTGWSKKSGTQTKVNNFFVMRYLKVSFAYIIPYVVQFMNLKGYFATTTGKNVMVGLQFLQFLFFNVSNTVRTALSAH